MRTDKKTSNLFIAGGYCLVAIIILLNYLGQAEVKEKASVKTAAKTVEQVGESALAHQLKEEKRVNLEMREMLTHLQGLLSVSRHALANQALPATKQAQGRYEIPDLNYELLDAVRPKTNPFIPGKNPFAAANRKDVEKVVANRGLGSTLRCDPSLPFIISGSGPHSRFISNF